MKHIYVLILLAIGAMSCNEWLDVRPDTEQKEEDQFSSEKGFYDAMTGVYMSMASRDIYGERLTMSNIESMANLWYIEDETSRYEDLYLMRHDYTSDYGRSAIETIYAKLFNTIAQANMIIKYAEERTDVFTDTTVRATLAGEAYGIRAFCQFDVLRLFGQMPQNASRQVELPYSETTSIFEIPPYYGFDAYVEKLKADLQAAESHLLNNDPLFTYTFSQLNGGGTDNEYMMYRQSRMNYWAVKALKARVHLYLGETTEAYQTAKEIIEATGPDGQPVRTMSGITDMPNYNLLPSECLFHLSKYDLMDYTPGILIGNTPNARFSSELVLTASMLTDLFAGETTGSNNRYASCWRKGTNAPQDASGNRYPVTTKYYIDENAENQTFYYQIIPMLRMSEVYLIAMETSENLDEVNAWYQEYMREHKDETKPDFASLTEAREWIINEYRREFFAEGQMFYTYKRTGATSMLWRATPVNENDYILPLPDTEYNPNNL